MEQLSEVVKAGAPASWFERALVDRSAAPSRPIAAQPEGAARGEAMTLGDLPLRVETAQYPSGPVAELRSDLPLSARACTNCGGVGWVPFSGGPSDPFGYGGTVRCDPCSSARRAVELLSHAGLPAVARDRSLSAIDWSMYGALGVRGAVWAVLTGESPGLLLLGTPGTGKTHLGMGMVLHRVFEGRRARWAHWPRLLADQKALFQGADGPRRDLIAELGAYDGLLVLDEIGEGSDSTWARGELYRLLDMRVQGAGAGSAGALVLTSNVAAAELATVLGQRQASRVAALCQPLALNTADYRLRRRGT